MSIRTILEINHDHISRMQDNPEFWEDVIMSLLSSNLPMALNTGKAVMLGSGIRVLAQRHHSEALTIEIV